MVKGDELKSPSQRRAAPFRVLLSSYSSTWKQNALVLGPADTGWLTNVFSSAQPPKPPVGLIPAVSPNATRDSVATLGDQVCAGILLYLQM